jgi:hypothetical protein
LYLFGGSILHPGTFGREDLGGEVSVPDGFYPMVVLLVVLMGIGGIAAARAAARRALHRGKAPDRTIKRDATKE